MWSLNGRVMTTRFRNDVYFYSTHCLTFILLSFLVSYYSYSTMNFTVFCLSQWNKSLEDTIGAPYIKLQDYSFIFTKPWLFPHAGVPRSRHCKYCVFHFLRGCVLIIEKYNNFRQACGIHCGPVVALTPLLSSFKSYGTKWAQLGGSSGGYGCLILGKILEYLMDSFADIQ